MAFKKMFSLRGVGKSIQIGKNGGLLKQIDDGTFKRLQVRNRDDSALGNLQVENPVLDHDVATKNYVDRHADLRVEQEITTDTFFNSEPGKVGLATSASTTHFLQNRLYQYKMKWVTLESDALSSDTTIYLEGDQTSFIEDDYGMIYLNDIGMDVLVGSPVSYDGGADRTEVPVSNAGGLTGDVTAGTTYQMFNWLPLFDGGRNQGVTFSAAKGGDFTGGDLSLADNHVYLWDGAAWIDIGPAEVEADGNVTSKYKVVELRGSNEGGGATLTVPFFSGVSNNSGVGPVRLWVESIVNSPDITFQIRDAGTGQIIIDSDQFDNARGLYVADLGAGENAVDFRPNASVDFEIHVENIGDDENSEVTFYTEIYNGDLYTY